MKVITAAVIGSLICGLLLVIALGCTCKLYALRLQEQHGLHRTSTPVSRIQDEIFALHLAPPPYAEAMVTSRPFEEVQREYLEHIHGAGARPGGRRNRHRTRPSRSHGGRSARGERRANRDRHGSRPATSTTQTTDGTPVDDDDDVPLIDISTNRESGNESEASTLIVPLDDSSDSEDEDSESLCDPAETSNVNISIATGISAQWRWSQRKERTSASSTDLSPIVGSSRDGMTRDTASLDTASASDSVILSIEGDDFKDDTTPTAPVTTTITADAHAEVHHATPANHRQVSCNQDDATSDGASIHSENLETIPQCQSHDSLGSMGEQDDTQSLL